MKALIYLAWFFSFAAFGVEEAFDGLQPLTEEEERESEGYIHAGIADRKHYEMCANDPEKCQGKEAWSSGSGMSKVDNMMPMVTKAYAMFTGLAGNKVAVKEMKNGEPIKVGENDQEYTYKPNKDGTEGSYYNGDEKVGEQTIEKSEDKTKDRMDVCGKLPMVVEGVSVALQTTQNDQTQQNYQQAQPQAQQRASFEALAKMHKDRADSSKYQAAGWGSVAACYAVDAAAFGAVMDWKLIAKMAASTLIAGFYLAKVDAHKDKAKMLLNMANELPGAGDCNPHTETTCFCAEETSYASDPSNYMKYCVPAELAREGNTPGYPCADKDGKPDFDCKCKKTNTCIQAQFTTDALNLGLNPAAMKNPLEGIRHLSTGNGSAQLGDITQRNLAMANKALKDYKPREKLNIGSNPKAKKLANDLLKAGLPKAAAATLAKHSANSGGSLPPGAVASFNPTEKPTKGASRSQNVNKGKNRMERGGSVKGSSSASTARSNPFGRRKSLGSGSRTSSVDIIDFAEKATREAEITKDKSKPIFDIITYRYKMRAWKEFEEEMQNHMIEEKKD